MHPALIIALVLAAYFTLLCLVMFLVATLGGWRQLAQRFHFEGQFPAQVWKFESARMRGIGGYRNALTVGADQSGLYIKPMRLFSAFHPPLFVPWAEISTYQRRSFILGPLVELRLGTMEQVPFVIMAPLAGQLQAAAGPSWPMPKPA
jgi:hypothetical protein